MQRAKRKILKQISYICNLTVRVDVSRAYADYKEACHPCNEVIHFRLYKDGGVALLIKSKQLLVRFTQLLLL